MQNVFVLLSIVLLCAVSFAQQGPAPAECESQLKQLRTDYANLARFHDANAQLPPTKGDKRVVFLGDTTLAAWDLAKYFPEEKFVNRAIEGQTTAQMLLRFHDDVLQLQPRAVFLGGGMADLEAGISFGQTQDNLAVMMQLAKVNNIRVLIGSLLPVSREADKRISSDRIREFDRWAIAYTKEHGGAYVDFWSLLCDEKMFMPPQFSTDGMHPSEAGYKALVPVLKRKVDEVWAQPLGRATVKGEYRPEP